MDQAMQISPSRRAAFVFSALILLPQAALAAGLVPGTGRPVDYVCDDFEDESWGYNYNLPKGSADVDKKMRSPLGRSTNNRWYEGTDRGGPDFVKRVPTPEGGLEGSLGSLMVASHFTGIPNRGNNQRSQDDLFLNVDGRLGRYIPVNQRPNLVVRVFMPELDQWEQHSGSSFGLRATVRGVKADKPGETEPYWPGMFFNYYRATRRRPNDEVWIAVRGRESGADYKALKVEQTGWWTLGMSFTPDGRIHYYARPGIEDLTEANHIASHYAYGFQCHYFINLFVDVFSQNDGRNGSTPWIIDDPTVYASNPEILVQRAQKRGTQQQRRRR